VVRRRRGLVALLGLALLAVAAASAWLLRARLWDRPPAPPADWDLPPGALEGYLPPDAVSVLSLDTRVLREAAAVRPLLPALGRLAQYGQTSEPWLTYTGINPVADLDELRVIVSAGDSSRPLWLARGRFDPDRFAVGPGRLDVRVADGHRVFEYVDPRNGALWLAVAGDMLISGPEKRVRVALAEAGSDRAGPVRDPVLRRMLAEVDQTRPAWLAASLAGLGRVGRLENGALELVLRPMFSHARGVAGGIAAGEELRADFHFVARDAEGARRLAEALTSDAGLAEGAGLLFGPESDLLPVFRLLAASEVSREDADVWLRGCLDADQLRP
jgi:hypothetical protein